MKAYVMKNYIMIFLGHKNVYNIVENSNDEKEIAQKIISELEKYEFKSNKEALMFISSVRPDINIDVENYIKKCNTNNITTTNLAKVVLIEDVYNNIDYITEKIMNEYSDLKKEENLRDELKSIFIDNMKTFFKYNKIDIIDEGIFDNIKIENGKISFNKKGFEEDFYYMYANLYLSKETKNIIKNEYRNTKKKIIEKIKSYKEATR